MALQFKSGLIAFAFVTLGWTSSCSAETPQQTPVPGPEQHGEEHRGMASAGEQLPSQPLCGSISGSIVDQSGAVVAGALVRLNGEDRFLNEEALSGKDGQFSLANIAPGPFQLTITSAGFATRTFSGILRSGEIATVLIALGVAEVLTQVQVGLSQTEVAEEQIKVEEKQRVLGVLPNFYVSYIPDAAPLNSKQKFTLAWKTVADPFTFLFTGAVAGVEQAQNHFAGYGQGAQGYGKRFGAAYADTVTGTFIGSAILPSLLKQDPRYFYKGSGSKRSRILYALANSVICKGDNRRWQPNYSTILGSLAVGGISNLYYSAQDRNGAGLTFENAGLAIGATAISSLFQEFLIRKLTPNVPNNTPAKP
jgi:Carboxypeptidase regulatory-like domain